MPRPQFTLKTLLWLMAVAAAFFAGSSWAERRLADERKELEESADQCFQMVRRAGRYVQEMEKALDEAQYGKPSNNPLVLDPPLQENP